MPLEALLPFSAIYALPMVNPGLVFVLLCFLFLVFLSRIRLWVQKKIPHHREALCIAG